MLNAEPHHIVRVFRSRRFYVATALMVMFVSGYTTAQPFSLELKPPFTIVHPSLPEITNPFSSGINRPIIQFVDIDDDGDKDLYLLDSDGRLSFYLNTGSASAPNFILQYLDVRSQASGPLAPATWFRLADIDRDGDVDLFCNSGASFVRFYRNTGSPQLPLFTWESDMLADDNNNPIFSESVSIPTFADVDGDDDLDFFSGNSVGSISYYENTDTTRQSFRFHFVTDTYQGITIIGFRRVPFLPVEESPIALKLALHGAMSLDFADVDADGDLDMFWGDFFNPSLYRLENTGLPTQPQFVLRDSTYPKPNIVQSNGFNMPQFVDIDNDGDLDMFVGILSGIPVDNFLYYKNVGTAQNPVFELQTANFLSTVDHGAASSPVFADLNGNGQLDLVIGTEDGQLVQYDRTGFGTGLQFTLNPNSKFSPAGFFNTSPAFADLDADGQVDLLLGEANGRIHLYRGSNSSTEDTSFTLRNVVFGQNAAPVMVDYDKDGDFDLFVGTGGGRIHYYRNDGTTANANFVLVSNFFDSIDVGDDAKPLFIDMDGDDDLDLVVGSRDSSLFYFQNESGLLTRVHNLFADVLAFPRAAPAFNDVDGDGDPDLVLGNYKGGLLFYRNNAKGVEQPPVPLSFRLKQNYPNPFNPATTINFELPGTSWVRLAVLNMLGQEVVVLVNSEMRMGLHTVQWDADGLPSGVYLYRLQAGKYVETRKALLLK